MTSPNLLQQLHHLDRSSSEFHDQLSNILYGEEYERRMADLKSDDLVSLVDYLDKALDILNPSSSGFRKCLRELRHTCGTRMILPASHILSSSVLTIDHRQPVASGGSGDIFKGTLNGAGVCVKRVRIYSKDGPDKAIKTLYQGAVVCKRLTHSNIVPLLGITPSPLQLISECMPGGDLTEYIKKHPDTDRLDLPSDIAQGLHFLHSRNIFHGDLKGPNILVDGAGHARITDFGLATVTQNLDSIRSGTGDHGHTARWTAPEILNEEASYSKEADIFSFAMVAIEVFTGAVPFSNGLPAAAMLAIMSGKRPPRPTHPSLTEKLWILIQCCWYQNPRSRPEISEVLNVLGGSEPPPLSLENQSGNVGFGESEDTGPYGKSQAAVRDLPSEQEDQSSEHDGRRRLRQDTDGSDLPSMPIDPQSVDLSELQKTGVHGRMGGTGKSDTNFQGAPDDSHQPHTLSVTVQLQPGGSPPGTSLPSQTVQELPVDAPRSENGRAASPSLFRIFGKLVNAFRTNRGRDARAPVQQAEKTRNAEVERRTPSSQASTTLKSHRRRWCPCL